ncbi:hypothetical protein [Ruoffia halotolerans]|nr:hypothetical protein [Ruoffia halotolerans]
MARFSATQDKWITRSTLVAPTQVKWIPRLARVPSPTHSLITN